MKLLVFISSLALTSLMLLFLSCTEDGGPVIGGGNMNIPPSLTLSAETGFVTGSVNLDAGGTFMVKVVAIPGSSPLNNFRVLEDGLAIRLDRITLDGQRINANPKLLVGNDKNGITYELGIQTESASAMTTYSFVVEDDDGITASEGVDVSTMLIGPTLTNNSTGTFEVPAGSLISINVDAVAGSADLTFIAIGDTEDAVIDDFSRFFYGDLDTQFDDNPFSIPGSDVLGFNKDIYIRAHETPGPIQYRIFLFDENEMASIVDITIIAGEPTNDIFGVLFNAAGPEGTGGLDLDEGLGTGSMSLLAEIKDEGIDLNQPLVINWKRQLSGVNGSIVRSLSPGMNGLSENYSFSNDFLREDLPFLFDSGIDFVAINSNSELVSPQVNVGDSFAVRNGDNYYLIFIREVNETGDNNSDSYTIDIKQ